MTQPVIVLNRDNQSVHYRTQPYSDPGANAYDDQTCDLSSQIITNNTVNTNLYGTYTVEYSVEDAAGNNATASRPVDIILPLTDYYAQIYNAVDSCTSGVYFYQGLIQDCDCDAQKVTVGNISNFGLSATFPLPVSGQYSELLNMDTTKAAVHFLGYGLMAPDAQSIYWEYQISDSVSTDVCRSHWQKF